MSNLDVEIFNTKLGERCRVFVPNKSGHDFSDALRYGDLQFVTKGTINRFSINYMARLWADALENSKPDDYILMTCMSHLVSIGCSIFGHKHGRLNLLIYRNGRYISRSINFSQLDYDAEE